MDEFFRQMKERDEMLRRLAEGPAAEYFRNQEALAPMSDLARTVDTNAVANAESRRATLAIATEKLVLRHTRLAESLAVAENPLHAMPAPVKELPTQGLFVHTGAVRSITPHESLSRVDNEIAVSIRVEVSM